MVNSAGRLCRISRADRLMTDSISASMPARLKRPEPKRLLSVAFLQDIHSNARNPRTPEIVPFIQQFLPTQRRQRISKTVPEIQPRRMSAPLAEIPIRLTRRPRLSLRDRLNRNPRLAQKLVQPSTGHRVARTIDHGRRLYEINRRHPPRLRRLDSLRAHQSFRLTPKNRHNGRTVYNHFGNPSSPYKRSPCSTDRKGSSSRAAQSRPIATNRSANGVPPDPRRRCNRSRIASVTAVAMLSPVRAASC